MPSMPEVLGIEPGGLRWPEMDNLVVMIPLFSEACQVALISQEDRSKHVTTWDPNFMLHTLMMGLGHEQGEGKLRLLHLPFRLVR